MKALGTRLFCSLVCLCGPATLSAQEHRGLVSGIELEHVSKSMGPGKDFYEYVNEGWLTKTKIPDDQSNYGSFTMLDDATKEAIKSIIEESAKDLGKAKGQLNKSVPSIDPLPTFKIATLWGPSLCKGSSRRFRRSPPRNNGLPRLGN